MITAYTSACDWVRAGWAVVGWSHTTNRLTDDPRSLVFGPSRDVDEVQQYFSVHDGSVEPGVVVGDEYAALIAPTNIDGPWQVDTMCWADTHTAVHLFQRPDGVELGLHSPRWPLDVKLATGGVIPLPGSRMIAAMPDTFQWSNESDPAPLPEQVILDFTTCAPFDRR